MAREGFVFRFVRPCAVAAVITVLGACGGVFRPKRRASSRGGEFISKREHMAAVYSVAAPSGLERWGAS